MSARSEYLLQEPTSKVGFLFDDYVVSVRSSSLRHAISPKSMGGEYMQGDTDVFTSKVMPNPLLVCISGNLDRKVIKAKT